MTDISGAVEKRIEQYLAVRDKIKMMEDEAKKAIEPFKLIQEQLAGWLQEFMDKTGGDSIKTKAGTAYVSTRYSATLADPDAFMQFVIENKLFDLLDRRANATAVKDYTGEKGAPPPGVNLTALKTIGVRSK